LALYLFSENRDTQTQLLERVRSGGACVNDTVLHLLNPRLPFGGLGESGMGASRGRAGFDTFSHRRSVLRRSTRHDASLRYPPSRTPLRWLKRTLPLLLR
jgi:aldehyde dehydrogenase (NAD+)